MKTLLKKAGIVAAVTTAGLLALSPLAFASGHGPSIEDSQVIKCTATQTNGLVSVLNLNGTLQRVNVLNDTNVQVSVGGNNTAD